jgi:predicted metal-dependent hydrolase
MGSGSHFSHSARVTTQIRLGDIPVDVVRKNIRRLNLTVHPPLGVVRISAPLRMGMGTILAFANSKLEWVRLQQKRVVEWARLAPPEVLDRDGRYVWGKRYVLEVVEKDAVPSVVLADDRMLLQVRPGTGIRKQRAILDAWYRDTITQAIPGLIEKWEPVMGVKVARFFVRKMKTKWGTCNTRSCHIRLNSELAKKPPECLEYVVAHELVHLLESSHNKRFRALMGEFMPEWEAYRHQLKG